MAVEDRSFSRSVVVTVYATHCPSGLMTGLPTCLISNWSSTVKVRVAWAVRGETIVRSDVVNTTTKPVIVTRAERRAQQVETEAVRAMVTSLPR